MMLGIPRTSFSKRNPSVEIIQISPDIISTDNSQSAQEQSASQPCLQADIHRTILELQSQLANVENPTSNLSPLQTVAQILREDNPLSPKLSPAQPTPQPTAVTESGPDNTGNLPEATCWFPSDQESVTRNQLFDATGYPVLTTAPMMNTGIVTVTDPMRATSAPIDTSRKSFQFRVPEQELLGHRNISPFSIFNLG